MNATELMIGDWVYDRILHGNTKIEKITINYIKGDIHDQDYTLTDFDAIPLSAEILEKNGFSLESSCNRADKHRWWYLRNNNRETTFMMNDEYRVSLSLKVIQIHYIHELQHALRLCGIEKEIIL